MPPDPDDDPETQPRGGAQSGFFPVTDWSLVLRATGRGKTALDQQSERALSSLCSNYWPPLFAYVRSRGYNHQDAEDHVQGLFEKLLKNRNLEDVAPEKGRLRNFLLVAMRRYLSSEIVHDSAKKRGGGERPISIDAREAQGLLIADEGTDPAQAYLRNWAVTLLRKVHADLRTEYAAKESAEIYDVLAEYLTPEGSEVPYADVAGRFGMSVGTVKVRIYRLRKRFREHLRGEIARGLADPADIEDELRCLWGAFAT